MTFVPEVAKPFFLMANGRVRSWDPVLFGLLISNCLFGATSAVLSLSAASLITDRRWGKAQT